MEGKDYIKSISGANNKNTISEDSDDSYPPINIYEGTYGRNCFEVVRNDSEDSCMLNRYHEKQGPDGTEKYQDDGKDVLDRDTSFYRHSEVDQHRGVDNMQSGWQGRLGSMQEVSLWQQVAHNDNKVDNQTRINMAGEEVPERKMLVTLESEMLHGYGTTSKPDESSTPTKSLQHAIGVLEENLDQLKDLYQEQEAENYRQTLDVNPIRKDHELINCLRRDLLSYEQQLLTIKNDLQSTCQNVEMLKMEKSNLSAQLAYERQMGALCLQSVTDQLTRIGSMMETGTSSTGCSSLSSVQQAALKTEISRLVKVLESEELRLTDPLSSTVSENSATPASNCLCLKPVDQNANSKNISNGVFHQKRIAPASVGAIRCRSAPVKPTTSPAVSWNPNGLGQGKDYFQTLYSEERNRCQENTNRVASAHPSERNVNAEVLPRSPSSTLHDLQIAEVQPEGKYIRIFNSSNVMEYELGNYLLQQNIGGHPFAVFRFPPRVCCPALATVTVWSEGCESAQHRPPSNFIFKGKQKWNHGSHVSTILCRPNGQAISWSTTMPRQHLRKAFYETNFDERQESEKATNGNKETSLGHELKTNKGYRKSLQSTSLYAEELSNPELRSSLIKKSLQSNAIPGLPLAGASGRRLGSASLRKFQARPFSATML